MNQQYPPIGTVSWGTMRSEDLIPAFMDVLGRYAPERAKELRESPENLEIFAWLEGDTDEPEPEYTSEFINEDLRQAMDEIAAPYTCFGASEGDGADYGYWPALETLEEDARYLDGVIKVDDGDEWHRDKDGYLVVNGIALHFPSPQLSGGSIDYVVSVSDHGNVTLYDAHTRTEIWSVV